MKTGQKFNSGLKSAFQAAAAALAIISGTSTADSFYSASYLYDRLVPGSLRV